jgi:hypothetical protein
MRKKCSCELAWTFQDLFCTKHTLEAYNKRAKLHCGTETIKVNHNRENYLITKGKMSERGAFRSCWPEKGQGKIQIPISNFCPTFFHFFQTIFLILRLLKTKITSKITDYKIKI